MPRNVEVKARIAGVQALLPVARAVAEGPEQLIEQDDTFFALPPGRGRLKLREFADGTAELIHYERADIAGAKASDYVRTPVGDADSMREALARSLGILGRVRKQRWLLMRGATRIHLDRVEGLGDFIELEVMLRGDQSDADGATIAEALMVLLGLADAWAAPRIAGAYLDLLSSSGGIDSARKS